ncbi:hypothetical protein C0989_004354 [Termitomyces sp. Mn162]|nr:hypothetical protein C0989_004354 [Termitomyces sp. Mn162]
MPPKKAGLSKELEPWLQTRILNISENPPRYEASWYGPYNALLSHFFPYTRQFMVKPQPKLRPRRAINPGESISNISLASAGYPVQSHAVLDESRLESDVFIPDFIVAKATESLEADQSLLQVEIKVHTDETSWEMGRVQLQRYMSRHMCSEGSTIYGLLICGGEAEMYKKASKEARTRIHLVGRRCPIKEKEVLDFLYRIAAEHW